MLFQELIRRKRDGAELSADELTELALGMADGRVGNEQLGAFAMAVYWRGMSVAEIASLTRAMRDSGRVMTWQGELNGPVLDKHSTGGIGDATSLLIGPWLAACGAHVPMISGRGLGHTGGTLDKLQSIPGYDPFPSPSRFLQLVRKTGVAIIGQTDDLAPADRRLYAVRDVTATVDCLPLIVASILSKKLAEGLDGLVLDVKIGSGAVMSDLARARELARALVEVAQQAGTPAEALLTDMDRPLGQAAGNALEVAEVIDLLTGRLRGGRLYDLSRLLSARALVLGGLASDEPSALDRLDRVWQQGQVAERFARMVAGLGGPANLLDKPAHYLAAAPVIQPVMPVAAGRVRSVDMRALGLAVVALGGGRRRAVDAIDPSVGLAKLAEPGQCLQADQPLAVVHAASPADAERAMAAVRAAYQLLPFEADPPVQSPLISERILVEQEATS